MKPRAVFDCMVFLQGAMRPTGPAAACFRLVDGGEVERCLSAELLAEVKDVLARSSLQRRYKTLAPENVQQFLAEVEAKAALIPDVPAVFSYPRNPKDECYVNLALAAGAGYLVTRDKDLLDLMDEGRTEGKDFRQRFPNLIILDPPAFLRAFFPQTKESPPAEEASPDTPSPGSG
jgi:putative PIN family toxin of toxin-antitoxin system